jgi:GDPmannose 4,6-dehydratase
MKLKFGESDSITIGNVNAFRDWSHIDDVIKGYQLLAEKGRYGDVYNQGVNEDQFGYKLHPPEP